LNYANGWLSCDVLEDIQNYLIISRLMNQS